MIFYRVPSALRLNDYMRIFPAFRGIPKKAEGEWQPNIEKIFTMKSKGLCKPRLQTSPGTSTGVV
jgi:hypothetical protein